jgi:hypothetical protein
VNKRLHSIIAALVIMTLTLSANGQEQSQYSIITNYNESSGRTEVRTEEMTVWSRAAPDELSSGTSTLSLTAWYDYPGQEPSLPASFTLEFLFLRWRNDMASDLEEVRNLAIAADGQRFVLEIMDRHVIRWPRPRRALGRTETQRRLNTTRERVRVSLPSQLFLQVASASQVQMTLGPLEFELHSHESEVLRALYRQSLLRLEGQIRE